jgi:hypothetical protein
MAPRPFRPLADLPGALERGELRFAIRLAALGAEDQGRPIDLELALRFLPLVVAQQPKHYDAWALRWLGRWITETPEATIEQAAEIAASLADLPAEPSALDALRGCTQTSTGSL